MSSALPSSLFALLAGLMLAVPVPAQDAAPADRNPVNTAARPGDMMADSPVTFPKSGALPAKYPPDRGSRTNEAPGSSCWGPPEMHWVPFLEAGKSPKGHSLICWAKPPWGKPWP